MKWLRRLLGRGAEEETPEVEVAPPAPAAGHNILVVTDIHLGEMLKDRSRIAYLKASTVQDREFCDLLEHYQANSPGDRPWRLILGGDVIDFLQVNVAPDRALALEKYGFDVSGRERKLGLDNTAAKVRWKLHRVMDRHRLFFTYLADFVGRGNEVVVIRGNHDAEFFWTEVHQAFRDRLADTYFGEEYNEDGEVSPDEFRARIQFNPWFYYEPGTVWLEHGHQHDAYCSLEHLLYPVLPWDREQMEWPAVSLAIWWGVNRITGFTTHDKDDWTFLDYIRWTMSARTLAVHRLVKIYIDLVREYFKYYTRYSSSDRRPIREIHAQVRRTLATEANLPDDVLSRMEALHEKPNHLTLQGTINISFVDRWVVIAFDIFAAAILAVAGATWWQWAIALAAIIPGNAYLLREMARRLDTYVPPKQRAGAQRIRDILPVRYVVMGHSHVPEVTPLTTDDGQESWYVNTGSWLHYEHTSPHPVQVDQTPSDPPLPSDPTAPTAPDRSAPDAPPSDPLTVAAEDPACDCGLTHVVLFHAPHAPHADGATDGSSPPDDLQLRRWCVRNRRPVRWRKHTADPT